jgi:hypothetical protein
MGSVGEVELEIPARSAYVSLTRQVVAAIAAVEPRFRTERIDDLRVAVSEATTNAVEAHADEEGTGRIRIHCVLDVDGDRITVADVDILREREYISRFQIRLMPTQIFFDAQGQEIGRHMGKISGDEILARLGLPAAQP